VGLQRSILFRAAATNQKKSLLFFQATGTVASFQATGTVASFQATGTVASLPLRHGAPHKACHGNNGGRYEQPPEQPEDASEHERGHDDSKGDSE